MQHYILVWLNTCPPSEVWEAIAKLLVSHSLYQNAAVFMNTGWNLSVVSVTLWEYTQHHTYLPTKNSPQPTNPQK